MAAIALDLIDPPVNPLRMRQPSIEDDAALQLSIAALGVLQPILVARTGNRYAVVCGERRRRMALAAGLTEIPVEVFARADEGAIAAAGAAENLVRAEMDPVDQWRAVVRLQSCGYTLSAAADCLGLPERRVRQLDKLGRLHPDVLSLIEATDIPWQNLAAIANAPAAQQLKAIKVKGNVVRAGEQVTVRWWDIARACVQAGKRISQKLAIFDVDAAKIAWDEDIFAEPGTPEQFTTTDVAGFIKAQHAALKQQQIDRAAKRQRMQIVDYDDAQGFKLPAGWKRTGGDTDAPKRTETVFATVHPVGHAQYCVAVDAKEEKAKEKAREKLKKDAAKKKAAAATPATPARDANPDTDTGGSEREPDADPVPDPEEAKPPITKAGLALIAKAKTEAVRQKLRSIEYRRDAALTELVALLVIALHATNVRILGYHKSSDHYEDLRGRDLMRRLVGPEGHPHIGESTVRQIACEALARTVSFAGPDASTYTPGSGDEGEWIGHEIDAQRCLPRFDTLEFLATVSGAELRRLADSIGVKLKGAGELRKRLVGQLPDWRPDAAQFGAPGPTPAADPRAPEREDDDE